LNNTFIKTSLLFLISAFFILSAYTIFNYQLVENTFINSSYGYSISILIIAFLVVLIIVHRNQTLPPSLFLYFLFIFYAIFGPLGARLFQHYFGLYDGKYLLISEYPLFVWSIGTLVLMVGILFSYLIHLPLKNETIIKWDLSLLSFFLWLTLGIAITGTIYALIKIGYIPLLKNNIDLIRVNYVKIVGELSLKMWRLWLIVTILSSLFIFLKKNKRLFVVIIIFSLLMLMLFGQRDYAFVGISTFIFIFYKFRKVKIIHLVYFAFLIIAFILYADYRSGRSLRNIPLRDVLVMESGREWREYSIIVNDIRKTHQFYGKNIFLGALVPILPKQIWSAFGVDKNEIIHKYGANFIFGKQFGDLIGIRIGTIGEAYAGFGLLIGVCLQMLIFGFIFGTLERIYLKMNCLDSRLSIICFFLGLLVWLPIATLYITVAWCVFFGFILFIILILSSYRFNIALTQDED